VDHRSDIFSLGVVLYEMAARRLPFGGATATETMDQILHAQPEAIGQAGRIPAELERIARKCIEKDRERRYQSARELLVDLRNLQRDSQPAALIAEKPFHAHGRNRKRVLAGLAVSVLAAFLFALSPWSRTLQVNQPIGSIVVLPFTNDSGNPDSEYLADGITETLINSLSHLPNLRVIARTTAFTYKGKSVDPREVHRALNVGAVLTGRLVQRGDALTVQVDLIDGQAGTQLWGERYMPQQANLFAFQDEVIRQVLERLNLAPSAEQQQRMAKQYSEDAEAHQLYLRGRYHTLKFTKEGMDKGLDLMNQALRLDPRYALGYAGLSEAYMTASDWYMPSIEAGVKAKEAALKAITLDDSLSEAHTAMAYVLGWFDWDWQNAEREFKRAIELNPGSEPAHYVYGTTLGMIGRVEESIAELKRAQQLDPLSGPVTFELGRSLYFARRYDEALDRLKVASELTPSSFLGRIYLGNVYELKAMYAEAIAEYEKTLQVGVGFPDARAWIGHGLAVAGRTADARKTLNELSREKPFTTGPWGMAVLHLGLGDKDQAIAWLERARDDRFIVLPSLKIDPIFNGLRSDPRFAAILLSMNLTP